MEKITTNNKKIALIGLGLLLVVSLGIGLWLNKSRNNSDLKPYMATWIPQNTGGLNGSLTIKEKDIELSLDDLEFKPGKIVDISLTTPYKETSFADGVYTLNVSKDSGINVKGNLTSEEKDSIVSQIRSTLKIEENFKFKLSSDNKELIELDTAGKETTKYKKKD